MQGIVLKKTFSSSWTMQFLEKLWKMWENKLIGAEARRYYLVSQSEFRSTVFFFFSEYLKVNNIALSAKDDKRIQSIDSIETYAYETGRSIMHMKRSIM